MFPSWAIVFADQAEVCHGTLHHGFTLARQFIIIEVRCIWPSGRLFSDWEIAAYGF